ncbi:MAG: RNA polymerase sigma factor FliA [Gammaproteobacteria bacterium]|nr:RNA polymerase sigma factor FliA [Gammaproteobacteria bacterium]MCF6229553.1 RNA polymerase sigma factor FliA [Gammaproteobacteria bacterium]
MYSTLQQSQDDLLQEHAPMVKRIAYHLAARLPSSVMVDDLIQAGMIGLLDASKNYDPTQGASFKTYSSIRIRGAMLDELRRNDWAPKSVHRKQRDITSAIKEIESTTGKDAKDEEIAQHIGIALDEYYKILQDASTSKIFSLDELALDDGAINGSASSSASAGPLEQLQSEDIKRLLADAIDALPEREKLVITLYYNSELNLREIGSVMGVSESRVSQIMSQATIRLKSRIKSD